MRQILCSTGALIGRPNGRNFKLLSQVVPRLMCDGYEFMLYDSWYDKLEELQKYLTSLSVSFPVFHAEKSIGELISHGGDADLERAIELFKTNCDLAVKIGSDKLVLHLWSGIDSDQNIEHNIAAYQPLREIADQYNLLLTIENVVCNHADPMTHMRDLCAAYPDIAFTFDTKMAEFHRQLFDVSHEENVYLLKHIRHMHINDYKGGVRDWSSLRTLYPGRGQIDFNRWFTLVREMKYTGDFTVEATAFDANGNIHCEMLNGSFAMIRGFVW